MQNKFHNRTLFVAAISVYLGLLIVGAPPHLLAQQVSKEKQRKLVEQSSHHSTDRRFPLPSDEVIIELGKVIAENATDINSTHFSYKTDYFGARAINLQILISQGSPQIIEYLRKTSADLGLDQELISPLASLPYRSFFYNFQANQAEIVVETVYGFDNLKEASNFAESHVSLINNALAMSKNKGLLESDSLGEVRIQHKNNQVFIVTRLPRAGLDALLKAGEKAN
jgi:hypothetical protein